MKNFTKMKAWLLLMVMSFALVSPAVFADGKGTTDDPVVSLTIQGGDLDLGEWPIHDGAAAWEEGVNLTIENDGTVKADIKGQDLDDPQAGFSFSDLVLPYTLDVAETVDVSFYFEGTVAELYQATYVVDYDATSKSVTTARVSATGYIAPEGDVYESAFDGMALQGTGTTGFTHAVVIADMRNNYNTPAAPSKAEAGTKDVVYSFTLALDEDVTVTSGNPEAMFALYHADFGLVGGPTAANAIVDGAAISTQLLAGDYFLVGSCNTDFDVVFTHMPQQVPAIAFNPSPADAEADVNPASVTLEWEVDEYASLYQVVYGTEYPPTEATEWAPVATSFELGMLDNNTQYFWQVNLKNTQGEATGDVWGFTTSISIPLNVVATVADTNDVTITWDALDSKVFVSYDIFRDGMMINAAPLTTNEFVDMDVPYNMVPGYDYTVKANYDEGVSDASAAAHVVIDGAGYVNGVVTELLDPLQPIAGATVTFTSVANTYVFTTDAVGAYEGMVMQNTEPTADNYTITVTATDYSSATLADVAVAYDATVTNNFMLDEFPYAPATVTAVVIDPATDSDVMVSWTMDSKEIQKFQVFRYACDGTDEEFLGEVLSGSQFIDNNWVDQVWGEYKYGVKVVYTNATSAPTYSTCLDKDMEVVVDVTVTTNSSDPVTGTVVTFTNVNDPSFVYTTDIGGLPVSGLIEWTDFRRGTYDITVLLEGFVPVAVADEVIIEDASFEWELIEITEEPSLLYVTPVGMATWVDPNAVEDVSFINETFSTEIPATWTITNGGDTEDTWMWDADMGGSAFVDSDAAGSGGKLLDEMLTSPVVDASSAFELFIEFDQYYRHLGASAFGDVDVFDGTEWVTVMHQTTSSANPAHEVIDVTEYANDAFQVRFHYTDGTSWAWYWGVTNVEVKGRALAGGKQFENYRVWHDGQIAQQIWETAAYQYGTEDPSLVYVAGEEYLAEVANVYTSGVSPKINYTWTYQPCEAFDGNANLDAYYVEGTTSNMIEWDALAADFTIDAITYDVFGTNVYRDGEMLAFVPQGTDMYTDENMTPGTYEYCTEVVYTLDAGAHTWTSCSANCVSDVVVPEDIFGQVSGLVYDAITMLPLEGATVTITNDDNTFVFVTDVDGMYAGDVVIGTYNYSVDAGAVYSVATLADVAIAYGATAENDFAMEEFPYPVSNVHATELSDTKVNVTWGEVAVSEWLTYQAGGEVVSNFGTDTDFSIELINKFPAEAITGLDGTSLTKVKYFQNEAYSANSYMVRISTGDDYTEVYSEEVTVVDGWNEITLATPVVVDPTATLWVSMYMECSANESTGATAASIGGSNDGGWFIFNNGAMSSILDLGYPGEAWIYEAFVTNEDGKSVAIGNYAKMETKDYSFSNATLSSVETETNTSASAMMWNVNDIKSVSTKDAKELMGYNVYRTFCDDSAEWEFLGYTLDTQFTDNAWGTADWGMYKWVVEAVYTNSVSEGAFSVECIDKDMNTVVIMEVTTTSGDSPSGTSVVFVNTLEEVEDITANIPGTGLKTIDPFRKGTYDITVAKTGFVTIELEDVVIHDTTTFVWELVEDLSAPGNLYVTPTGLATWTGLGGGEFVPFTETFDDASSFENWEVIVGGSSADTWFWNDGTNGQYAETLDGTPYAFVDSDDAGSGSTMDEMLISPVIDASNAGELFIEFDQFYNNLSAEELADVEVYNGSEWITVLHQAEDLGGWSAPDHVMIDVTEHANADFRVRFHYVAPGWDWHWAVDNVVVTNEAGKSSKEIVEYLVYHDGANTNNVQEPMYQYGLVETEALVSGETYLAEVAAAYTTGISERAAYTWTYLPCDSFPAYAYYNAEGVPSTNDVLVNWSSIGGGSGSGPADYYEEFEGAFPPAGWMKANPDGGTGFEAIAAGTTPLPGWNGGEAVACPEGGAQMAYASWQQGGASSNDQWLISPMLEAYDGYELSFYMDVPYADSYLENVDILISTTGTDVADFTVVVENMTFTSLLGWQLYTYDLVDLGLLDSGDEFYVAINEHVDDNYNNGAAVLFDNFYYGAPSKMAQPETGIIASVGGRNLNSVHAPAVDAPYQEVDVKSVTAEAVVLGTNIYRDAEFIAFVPVADTFYLDMDLEPGIYEYCAAVVYTEDEGLHTWESCEGEMCDEATVEEDCVAPTNLVAEDLLGDGYTATLTWGSIDPQFEWLYYDTDVMQYTGIGAEASDYSLIWGMKFTPDMLEEYAPGFVTKLSVFQGASVGDYLTEARVMSGDGMNVLYSQDVTGTLVEGWNEIELDEAVAFDNTEDLWIGFYVERPGATANEPTSPASVSLSDTYDFFAYNGAGWTSIQAEYGIAGQSWMLRGYVTNSAGKSVALGNVNTNNYTEYTSNGQTGVAMIPADPNYVGEKFDFGNSSKGFLGYNIYRDGDMIEENWPTTGYADDLGENIYVCYTVTANYEFCGESAHSNEACVEVGVGIDNVVNNISVYPNPAKDYVTVEASSDIRSIKVTNYMGQVISYIQSVEVTSHTIATSSYSSGVYFVEVETAAGVEKVRIVISE